ncbi:YrrS family protein [Pontibacillus salipaludis]|uniref:YrrS family protein n=1 Tax=Pontibacillus salipaludis TaxID=1697394 RepID=UPI0031E9B317
MSRVNLYEKKRKNTKLVTGFSTLALVFVVLLIGIIVWPFGGNEAKEDGKQVDVNSASQNDEVDQADSDKEDKEQEGNKEEATQTTQDSPSDKEETSKDEQPSDVEEDRSDSESGSEEESEEQEEQEGTEKQTVDSDEYIDIPSVTKDDNVIEVYQDKWKAIQTEQEGKHVATFDDTTQDWNEMLESIYLGSGLSKDNSTLWRVHNGGDNQTAVATISDKADKKTYRVYTAWVEGKGWKPMKVEVIKENKYKSQS